MTMNPLTVTIEEDSPLYDSAAALFALAQQQGDAAREELKVGDRVVVRGWSGDWEITAIVTPGARASGYTVERLDGSNKLRVSAQQIEKIA